MPVNLTDTTVLSNFSQVERPGLLRAVFPDLAAPFEVREELSQGERLALVPSCDWTWLKTIELTDPEQVHATQLREHLEAGEAACIAVVASRGGLLLSDDAEARRTALALQIEVSGTIGVLDRLCQRTIIDFEQGNALLQAMIDRGYRSPVRSLRQFPPDS
jgi:predicted nucleic acid-binding protein